MTSVRNHGTSPWHLLVDDEREKPRGKPVASTPISPFMTVTSIALTTNYRQAGNLGKANCSAKSPQLDLPDILARGADLTGARNRQPRNLVSLRIRGSGG